MTDGSSSIGAAHSAFGRFLQGGGRKFRLTSEEGAGDILAEPSRAEPSRAEPSRAEPSRAEPSRAEPSRAEPSRAEPSRAEPSRAEPSRAEPSRAEPSRAEPSRAEPSRAEPSRAEPSRAEPSRAEPSRAEPSRALKASARQYRLGCPTLGLELPLPLVGAASPVGPRHLPTSPTPSLPVLARASVLPSTVRPRGPSYRTASPVMPAEATISWSPIALREVRAAMRSARQTVFPPPSRTSRIPPVTTPFGANGPGSRRQHSHHRRHRPSSRRKWSRTRLPVLRVTQGLSMRRPDDSNSVGLHEHERRSGRRSVAATIRWPARTSRSVEHCLVL